LLLLLFLGLLGFANQLLADFLQALALAAVLGGVSHGRDYTLLTACVRQRTEYFAAQAHTDAMNIPQLPKDTGTFIWGAGAGAIAAAFVGFTWGGWVGGTSAERMASTRAETATLAALTPICVAQFNAHPKAKASLATLKETKTWEQADFVRNGGWATMPGTKGDPSRDVANACAEALVKQS
jgi:hypothetical protein